MSKAGHTIRSRRRMLAAAAMVVVAGLASAQERRIDPTEISGRTFDGLRLPVAVSPGRISFAAARAQTWTELEPAGAEGQTGRVVQRMLLTGDVVANLGSYDLTATRACVWLARVEPPDPDAGPDVWQVFVYMERGGSSTKAGGITVRGDKLPVQGVIKVQGGIGLNAAKHDQGRPAGDAFLAEAERALALRLRKQVEGQIAPGRSPEELVRQGQQVLPIEVQPGEQRLTAAADARMIAEAERNLPVSQRIEPIFASEGVFSFSTTGDVKVIGGGGEQENAVVLSGGPQGGGVTVSYWDRVRDRTIQLTAEHVVVFLKPGPLMQDYTRVDKDAVVGIYLEGDVIADMQSAEGRYSLRAPRVFYSVKDNRAILLDAVFWTIDQKRNLPIYVRAKTIEQESANQFKATSARITNTPFFEPDLALGATSVTIQPRKDADGTQTVYFDAKDITLRAANVPFFYWPRARGEADGNPLRDLRLENSSGSGTAIKTTWDAYTLLGLDRTVGNSSDVMLDWYFDRGAGLGTNTKWQSEGAKGGLLGYLVPTDNGEDVLQTGEKKAFDGQTRGMILAEHVARLTDEWTLFAEGSYISDETFIDGYFDQMGRNRREFTNAIYLRRLSGNSSLSVLAATSFNDFISNEYLKQTPGYVVDKYPDARYVRLADDLLEAHPGLLTYSSEFRLSQMRLNFDEVPAKDYGFSNPTRSQAFWGITPDQSIADALRAQGYSQEPVTRFDTRHELTMPLAAGPVNITPFAVGRFTGYSDDFEEFSKDADQWYRLWGSAGVRVGTELQHVDNGVESRLMDLHRIRHIVQPSMTIWYAGTTIDGTDLPVYDDGVESLAEGTAVRFAVDQTWQTQRGGPGRWRSVDVFRFNAELVVSSGDVNKESPIGRYMDYRPEYSNLGDTYGTLDAAWQVTEAFALGGNIVFDFDINQPARTNIGAIIQHNPYFSTYLDLRYLNSQDSTIFIGGADYELTRKYTVSGNIEYDTELGAIQSVSGGVRRRYPNVILGFGASYNNITNETSFSFVFQPVGVTRSAGRLQGIGSANPIGGM